MGSKVKFQQGQKWTSKATVLCPSPLTLQSYHWMAAMESKGHNDWTARGRPNLLCTYAQHGCLEDVQTQGGGSFKHRNLCKIQPCKLPRLYSSDTDSFEQINKWFKNKGLNHSMGQSLYFKCVLPGSSHKRALFMQVQLRGAFELFCFSSTLF